MGTSVVSPRVRETRHLLARREADDARRARDARRRGGDARHHLGRASDCDVENTRQLANAKSRRPSTPGKDSLETPRGRHCRARVEVSRARRRCGRTFLRSTRRRGSPRLPRRGRPNRSLTARPRLVVPYTATPRIPRWTCGTRPRARCCGARPSPAGAKEASGGVRRRPSERPRARGGAWLGAVSATRPGGPQPPARGLPCPTPTTTRASRAIPRWRARWSARRRRWRCTPTRRTRRSERPCSSPP